MASKTPSHDRWVAEHTVRFSIKLNRNTDADLITALEDAPSKAGMIKRALRDYLSGSQPQPQPQADPYPIRRFASYDASVPHTVSRADLERMSDRQLIAEINRRPGWDHDLLHELVWRAYPDATEQWEDGDPICYAAAEKLGGKI